MIICLNFQLVEAFFRMRFLFFVVLVLLVLADCAPGCLPTKNMFSTWGREGVKHIPRFFFGQIPTHWAVVGAEGFFNFGSVRVGVMEKIIGTPGLTKISDSYKDTKYPP